VNNAQIPQISNASPVQFSSGSVLLELIDLNVLLDMHPRMKMTMLMVSLKRSLSKRMIRESAQLITWKALKMELMVSLTYLFLLKITVFKLVLEILE